jgi:hypothetical protein
MSSGRGWLDVAIAEDYLPFIQRLKDSAAGRRKLLAFVSEMRDRWADQRKLVSVGQQKSLMGAVRNEMTPNFRTES